MVEGHVLGNAYIEELLAMVDQSTSGNVARLTTDRDRLRREVKNLVRSVAATVPAETAAPGIRGGLIGGSKTQLFNRRARPKHAPDQLPKAADEPEAERKHSQTRRVPPAMPASAARRASRGQYPRE
jgi:hypothetical protein